MLNAFSPTCIRLSVKRIQGEYVLITNIHIANGQEEKCIITTPRERINILLNSGGLIQAIRAKSDHRARKQLRRICDITDLANSYVFYFPVIRPPR